MYQQNFDVITFPCIDLEQEVIVGYHFCVCLLQNAGQGLLNQSAASWFTKELISYPAGFLGCTKLRILMYNPSNLDMRKVSIFCIES